VTLTGGTQLSDAPARVCGRRDHAPTWFAGTDYRAAVDDRLFGLGRERYGQMVDMPLRLRKPLLAKDLDPIELSKALTSGLRPVEDNLVAQAAGERAGATEALHVAKEKLRGLQADQASLDQRLQVLLASDAYRQQGAIDQLRARTKDAQQAVSEHRTRLTRG
jgi:hypothetical protein